MSSEADVTLLIGRTSGLLNADLEVGVWPVAHASNICACDIARVPLIRLSFGVDRFSGGANIFREAGAIGVVSTRGDGARRGVVKASFPLLRPGSGVFCSFSGGVSGC